MLWNFVGAAVLIAVGSRLNLQWGRLLGLYLVWYGIGRAALETLRLDPAELIGGLRVNFLGALFVVLVGLVIIGVQGHRHPGLEPSPYRPGSEWVPEIEVDSKDTYFVVDDDSVVGDNQTGQDLATSDSKAESKK
jgi:hypothetical protein